MTEFDETIRNYGDRRQYRRKKKYQGASWTPPSANADKPDGLWCRACMKHHGYKSMGLSYNRTSQGWEMLWSCTRTNNIIGTTLLGGNGGT